jgi:putative ABC transport system permease protein
VQLPSRNMILVVRTDQPVPGLPAAIRRRIAELDGTVALPRITPVAEALDRYLLQRRFQTILLGLFSAIALLLAAVGTYGLLQHNVAQRTREIGVRMAVGAASHRVIAMILRQGLMVALPGLALGIVAALWLSDALSALLFGVPASDLTSIALTSGILLLTTLVASYVPARRAANVDPMVALRYQ